MPPKARPHSTAARIDQSLGGNAASSPGPVLGSSIRALSIKPPQSPIDRYCSSSASLSITQSLATSVHEPSPSLDWHSSPPGRLPLVPISRLGLFRSALGLLRAIPGNNLNTYLRSGDSSTPVITRPALSYTRFPIVLLGPRIAQGVSDHRHCSARCRPATSTGVL